MISVDWHWALIEGVLLNAIRPCSVDSLDGGATDVPMEIKNYIIILFYIILPTCRFQNFLRIENRTIKEIQPILYRKVNFYIIAIKNTQNMSVYFFFLPTYRLEIMKIGKKFLFLWFFFFFIFSTDRLYQKGSRKICYPMNQPSMA